MHEVLARGGVIMGSSAGASIQADYLARANPLGNRDIIAEGYERGLGFIKGVAIDQHFAQRKRFKDMSLLVARYPQLLGIGIDEGTALIVEGEVGRVTGSGSVHFYDRRKPVIKGEPDYESVRGGGSYQMAKRLILDPGKP
jgi:cyanophycinase